MDVLVEKLLAESKGIKLATGSTVYTTGDRQHIRVNSDKTFVKRCFLFAHCICDDVGCVMTFFLCIRTHRMCNYIVYY